jgi:hypothetical protein
MPFLGESRYPNSALENSIIIGEVQRLKMAWIGSIYLGGKESGTPNSDDFPSGIAFPLKRESEIDYTWASQDLRWQVELKRGHVYAVARSHDHQAYDSLVTSGLEQIQRCQDIIAVKKLGVLLLDHPESDHVGLFQRDEESILRHFSVSTLGIATSVSVEVRDKDGNIKPPAPIPEPIWTWAFRYYRLSQASQDIFEAYRNLFLSLEALLNNIRPKLRSESEKRWLKNALSEVATKVQLGKHTPPIIADPIDYFMRTQYEDIRCRLFHAKYPDALLPHEELNPTDVLVAYESLLRLWRDIAETYFRVPHAGGVVTYQGFRYWMDKLFSHPLSLYFTEDNSPPQREDTQVSPLGLPTFKFEQSPYLGETKPGVVSWQGEMNLLDIHKNLSIHRICSLVDNTLLNVAFIKDGLCPSCADVFQTYQNMRLLNVGQPKTTF